MFDCRRDTDDPLVRAFLDTYGLNLIRWPREGVEVGQTLVERPDRTLLVCALPDVFEGAAPNIEGAAGRAQASMSATFSNKIAAKAGVGVLNGVAEAFGARAEAKLDSAYKAASDVRVKLRQVTLDEASTGALARFVAKASLRGDQALFRDGDRIYVITAVARARAIEIVAFDKSGKSLTIDVKATGVADPAAGLTAEAEGAASIVYRGARPLAFGVQVMEIAPDPLGTSPWRLDTVRRAPEVRGTTGPSCEERRLLGGASTDGDAFFDWPG